MCSTSSQVELPTKHILLEIPPEHRFRIPSPELSISELLALSLPLIKSLDIKGNNLFSSRAPANPVPDNALSQMIPPLMDTVSLIDLFDEQLRNGSQSIMVPGLDSPLPFWVLSLWKKIGKATETRRRWERARTWVEAHAKELCPDLVMVLLRALEILPWNLRLKGPAWGLEMAEIADFLSEDLVSGRIIDAIMTSIAGQVSEIPHLAGTVSVEDLTFSQALRLPEERWQRYDHDRAFSLLRCLGDLLAAGVLEQLVIPVNISGTHWALFLVDARLCQIRYGDSLGWTMHRNETDLLNQWLRHHGFESFSKGSPLPHGEQLDSYSCSVAMTNIARHFLFGDPLFKDSNKHILRIQEALNILSSYTKKVETHGGVASPRPFDTSPDLGTLQGTTPTDAHVLPSSKNTTPSSTSFARGTSSHGLGKYFQRVTREEHLEAIRVQD
jgi:hypothetical protein